MVSKFLAWLAMTRKRSSQKRLIRAGFSSKRASMRSMHWVKRPFPWERSAKGSETKVRMSLFSRTALSLRLFMMKRLARS